MPSKTPFFLLATLLLFDLAFSSPSLRQRRQTDAGDEYCECVPYFLCDENNRIVTSGDDLLDVRIGQNCGEVEVCCRPPEGEGPPDGGDGSGKPNPSPPPPTPRPPVQPPVRPPPPTPTPPKEGGGGENPLPIVPQGGGCGLRRLPAGFDFRNNADRITGFGGIPDQTFFGEHPWMVGILKSGTFQCGGSLIKPNVVLTAGHCVVDVTEPEQLIIRIGEWDTQTDTEPIPYQEIPAKRFILHPDYNVKNLANDVALIFLQEPAKLSESVDVICLPENGFYYNATSCLATGWGRNAFATGEFQAVLRQVDLPIVQREECQNRLRKTRLGKYFKLHASFVCAGGIPEQDTCQGDGGGPLICQSTKEPDRYVQIGIVSWGIGCSNENPAVYSSTEYHVDWIKKHIQ